MKLACLIKDVFFRKLIINLNENFSSNIIYFDVVFVFDTMTQIHCLIAERVRFLNFFREFVDEYYSKKRYTKHVFLDSQIM